MRNTGFVFIKVSIVIIIISVLAVILFLLLSKGRQAICINNLKQIEIALFMHIVDYEDYFPVYDGLFPFGYWLCMGRAGDFFYFLLMILMKFS